MLRDARLQKITEILNSNGNAKVSELQAALDVSEMTIRRDLKELENTGVINRVYGGALSLKMSNEQEQTFKDRIVANINLKSAIAAHAVTLLSSGSFIFIDASSTCSELASRLPENLNLTVVTNSIEVLMLLRGKKSIQLISLGGELSWDKNTFDGALAIDNAELLSVDICFFSGAGFSAGGIANSGMIGTMLKRTMINKSKQNYFLADSTKFGRNGIITFCKWDKVDLMITDSGLHDDARDMLKAQNVNYTEVSALSPPH